MSLAPGSKLGPYEIVSPLGAGGMGEVFRALDSRLGREVALKILPAAVAFDEDRRARFEREARAAAALNHPNIVGVFDIGTQDGVFYMATELVNGETLGAVIDHGPVPTKKLLDLATQIADGMSAAHAARITHRDLKPANIMVATDGRAKILDFGLAKRATEAKPVDQTATIAHQTSPGMIVGTASYMSPEQARGRDIDYRSDQFSFGLILYEMASGKRAFERPESVQILSAILSEDPPPLDPKVPAPLRWVIDRCLAKEPQDRYESTRDLFQDLRGMRDHLAEASSSSMSMPAIAAPQASEKRTLRGINGLSVALAFLAGFLSLAVGLIFFAKPSAPDQSTYRFTPFSFETAGQCCTYWSPDGKSVAYSAIRSGQPYQVYLRILNSPTPLQLTHLPDDASARGWSADGKHVLFYRYGMKPFGIWSVSTVGGDPEFLFPLEREGFATAFSADMRSYAALHQGPDGSYGVWHANPPGSPLKKYEPDPFATREVYNSPRLAFSPDDKQLLMYLNGERHQEEAWLIPYPPDPKHPPKRVFTSLTGFIGTPEFTWTPDNRHVILAAAPNGGVKQLWMADTQSEERYALTSGTTSHDTPRMSPDGSRLLFQQNSSPSEIISVDLADASVHPLIATDRAQTMPAWAANAPILVYVTDRNGPAEIWLHGRGENDRPVISAAESGNAEGRWLLGPTLSPDGARLIYTMIDRDTGAINLWMASVRGGAPVRVTNDRNSSEFTGSWSPDGAWFVYRARLNGKDNLMKVKTSGEATPVVLKAGVNPGIPAVPCWSPTNEWIAYPDQGDKLISPDGTKEKDLGQRRSGASTFSADGKILYGMRQEDLIATNIETGAEKVIGNVGVDNAPRSNQNPAVRMSLSPDGKSVTYGTIKFKNNLWIFEGFTAKRSFFDRF